MENIASKNNLDAIYLDTAEPAKQVIDWYLRLGCKKIGYLSRPNTNYYSVVLRKTINGKKYNQFYLRSRYVVIKMLCIFQYRYDGKMRRWRKAISKVRRCLKKQQK